MKPELEEFNINNFQEYSKKNLKEYNITEIEDFEKKLNKMYNINDCENAKLYIELLNKFKERQDKLNNIFNESELIGNQVKVGSDSRYSEILRFLYEIIQNVDDCEYENNDESKNLTIEFNEKDEKDGKKKLITLKYNEKGFTSKDVYAISSFNSSNKQNGKSNDKIGEKGIGFKSIFGVAKKVFIKSYAFSFSFETERYIVPVPEYNDYNDNNKVKGTELELYLDDKIDLDELFKSIINKYNYGEYIGEYLNDNPVIFLNKLTSICYKNSKNGEYILFEIDKKNSTLNDNISKVEDELKVEDVELKVKKKISNKTEEHEIKCYKFTKEIEYNKEECDSRYKNNKFINKRENIIAITPQNIDKVKANNLNGSIYYFLPTTEKTNVPIIFNIPLKLTLSREGIDTQSKIEKNEWFNRTISELSKFTKNMYKKLSSLNPDYILDYIPTKCKNNIFCNKDIFEETSFMLLPTGDLEDKNEFISKYEIFNCLGKKEEYECHSLDEAVYVNYENEYVDEEMAKEILSLLDENAYIIKSKSNKKYSEYGIKEKSNLLSELSKKFLDLNNEETEKKIMKIFDEFGKDDFEKDDFEKIINNQNLKMKESIENVYEEGLSVEKIKNIYEHRNYKRLLMNSINPIKIKDENNFSKYEMDNNKDKELIDKNINIYKIYNDKKEFEFLNKFVNLEFKKLSILKDDDFLITEECFYYTNITKAILNCLSLYLATKKFNKNNLKELEIIMCIIMDINNYELENDLNETSAEKFIKSLMERNIESKNRLDNIDEKFYEKFFKLLNDNSVSEDAYIYELIQNANDLEYNGDTCKFNLKKDRNKIIAFYNEKGFTRQDIVSITSFSKSTKIDMNSENGINQIGEKGIGFKSVFKIAKEVEINSGEYHFSLNKNFPTIPKWISGKDNHLGTEIILYLDEKIDYSEKKFNDKEILELILGISKINKFNIFGKEVEVTKETKGKIDKKTYLIKEYNKETTYEYYIYKYKKLIENENALEKRRKNRPNEPKEQYVEVIFPVDTENNIKGKLYCGLPTTIETNCPICINAHFELNTSREGIMENNWNEEIIKIVANAILEGYENLKEIIGLDILKYLTNTDIIKNRFLKEEFNNIYEKDLKEKKLLKNSKDEWIPIKNAIIVEKFGIEDMNNIKTNFVSENEYVSYSKIKNYENQYNKPLEKLKSISNFYVGKDLFDKLLNEDLLNENLLIENDEIRKKFFEVVKEYPKKEELSIYFKTKNILPYKSNNNDKNIGFTKINEDIYYSDKENIYYSDNIFILDTNLLSIETYKDITNSNLEKVSVERIEKDLKNEIKRKLENMANNCKSGEFNEYLEKYQKDLKKLAEEILGLYNKNNLIIEKIFEQLKQTDEVYFNLIPIKNLKNQYYPNSYNLHIHKETKTIFDKSFIDDDYVDMAKSLGKKEFIDISQASEYPFCSITQEQLDALFGFELNNRYELFYSIMEEVFKKEDSISKETLKNNFFKIIDNPQYINFDVLSNIKIDDIPIDGYIENINDKNIDNYIKIIEKISFRCKSITFGTKNEQRNMNEYKINKVDIELIDPLIKEIRNDIELLAQGENKEDMLGWINEVKIYFSEYLDKNLAIRTKLGSIICLGKNVKTSLKIEEYIKELLKNNFGYEIKVKNIKQYDRYLFDYIGRSEYKIKDALKVSNCIDEKNIENKENEKRLLCEPYEFEGNVYGGYAKKCPLCGSIIHTELTGFRIVKIRQTYKNRNIVMDILCCPNCFSAFRYADKYEIEIEEFLKNRVIKIKLEICGEKCLLCEFTPKLVHMGLIIKMNKGLDELFPQLI